MASSDTNDFSRSYGDKSSAVRKLRKKLRQIEKLERLERELSKDEEKKVDSKDKIRSELQELVKTQEARMVSLTVTKTEKEESKTTSQDEISDTEKLDVLNAFDTNNVNGHHLGFKNSTSHFHQMNGHNMMGTDDLNGHSFNGHALNGHAFNGHLNAHAVNAHGTSEHHVGLNHHNQASHLTGGSGFSLGFNEDGEIIADITESSDINGKHKITLIESVITDEKNEEDLNIAKSLFQNKKLDRTIINNVDKRKIDPLFLFQGLAFKMRLFEGHHHDTCATDIFGDYVISGGRDTSFKLWLATTLEELKSLGGHDGTITGAKFLKDKSFSTYPKAMTSSYDCSLKVWNLDKGKIERSIYVYSPVCCLDYSNGLACIGTEGGKVELYNIESGEQEFTVMAHEDQVTAVKVLTNGKIASGSTDGILKIYDPKSDDSSTAYFVLDVAKLTIKQAIESEVNVTQFNMSLTYTKINCIACYKDLVIYGDEGYNVKVLDYEKGEIVKLRNNLKEFSPTEALYVSTVKGCDLLFAVGSDVDNGDGFTNVRSLPDFRYLGTIRDPNVNSGAITSFCLEEVKNRIRFITGGAQLRTWDQMDIPRRAKKRKSSSDNDEYVPCKYVCTYTVPRESEPESENDEDNRSQLPIDSMDSREKQDVPKNNSWCAIL